MLYLEVDLELLVLILKECIITTDETWGLLKIRTYCKPLTKQVSTNPLFVY